MNKPIELMCAHSIILCCICIGVGFFFTTGWMPPISPQMEAEDVVQLFNDDRFRIQIGATIGGFGSMFYWAFAGSIATQMRRIEGEHHPLTRIQMAASNGTAIALMFFAFLLLTMSYRPDLEPTAMRFANDFYWILLVGLYPPGVMQNMAIGFCILSDKKDAKDKTRVFPRWVGFANFWVAILFIPGLYIIFFKGGPFAWDGILAFWVVAIAFFAWCIIMWWHVIRAIKSY